MFAWILGVAVVLIVAFFIVPLLTAATAPPDALARAAISQKLTELAIEPSTFTSPCITDLAEASIQHAKRMAQLESGPWRSHLQESAEGIAIHVAFIVTGESGFTTADIRERIIDGTAPEAWEILAKHDPKRFSIDNLEKTQSASQLLRQVAI